MIFTTKNRIFSENIKITNNTSSSQPQPPTNVPKYSPIYMRSFTYREAPTSVPISPPPPPPPKPAEKKMLWGAPTWALLHTLAEKIHPTSFSSKGNELLNVINIICNNLPCPTCAKHASEYMRGINFNAIQSKEQLKKMLFQFHNEVNKRKGYPLFPESELEPTYSKAQIIPILENFMVHFEDKHYAFKMLTEDFHRGIASKQLKNWFRANLQHFKLE